jgi:hypothetical protein
MCSTLQWFGRTTLALLLVVGLPQFAHAAFIDLVSQSYRIHAYGAGYGPGPLGPVVDYDETADTPISRQDDVSSDHGGGYVGQFFLSTSADGGLTPANAFVRTQNERWDIGFATAVTAEASAAITFRPLVADVVVEPHFFSELGSSSGLLDVTADAAVLAFTMPGARTVSLNLEHLYMIYASSSGIMSGATLSIASAGPAAVPESESTLTFFVVGLGALLLVARSTASR